LVGFLVWFVFCFFISTILKGLIPSSFLQLHAVCK
jgi:hypothetical protein